MAKLLKLRRGSTSQHSSFTGAEGEVTVDTDKDVLVVHDGSTAGGHPLAAQDMDNVPAGAILGTQLENSGVTAGQYGSSSAIPIVSVDAQGLVTAASTTAIDSTTIANGSSSVAVANNGNITANRSGTNRLVVDGGGIVVTGVIGATDRIDATNTLNVTGGEGTSAALYLIADQGDDNGDGWRLNSNQDVNDLTFANNTSGSYVDKMTLTTQGGLSLAGGLSVTGDTTINGTTTFHSNSAFPINLNGSDNGKIVLQGANSPYIRFREQSTDKAYIQWDSSTNPGELILVNQESSDYFRIGSGSNGLKYTNDGSNASIWHSGNDGSGSGLDADTLDGVQGANFLRSDADDTSSGQISLTYSSSYPLNINGGDNAKIVLQGSSSPYIRWREGTTDRAYMQYDSSQNRILIVNQETGEILEIGNSSDGLKYTHDGTASKVWHSGNDGTGSNLDADRLDGLDSADFLRANAADSTNALITASAGLRPGNLSVGESAHANTIQQVSGGTLHLQYNVSGNIHANEGGGYMQARTIRPETNNSYDLGTSSYRWRNIYTNDLHLSNVGHSNDVDGTWGDWTIQEGESDLFLKNNRSGKKYKFNLMEIS